ncbi:MAG TPA: sodium/proton-translocating pyrophosphatase, partial [Acidimicrobiia bacterium]|nr:sodium/proton-translocating pyrophosphatase [Acidimicrobiia bacterium]
MDLSILAAEGGYQDFTLGPAEWTWLWVSAITAVVALLVGVALSRGVLRADKGTAAMQEIALAIQEGAMAYLRRQFKTIAVILVPLALVVFFTSTAVLKPDGTEALSFAQSGAWRTIAFVMGG